MRKVSDVLVSETILIFVDRSDMPTSPFLLKTFKVHNIVNAKEVC